MDVIGAGGPLGSRQLLTTRTQATQPTQVDRAEQQASRNRGNARALQESTATQGTAAATDPTTARSAQRAAQQAPRSVSTADLQNRQNPLPRGSLVNIVV